MRGKRYRKKAECSACLMFLPVCVLNTPAAGTGIKHIIRVTMKEARATCQGNALLRLRIITTEIAGKIPISLRLPFPQSADSREGTCRINALFSLPRCTASQFLSAKRCLLPPFRTQKKTIQKSFVDRTTFQPENVRLMTTKKAARPDGRAAFRSFRKKTIIPDPSCGRCSGRHDGPRPWPE